MEYPVESFNEAEREALRPHFTNLDRPVFALVNLPETVTGALFARYSRSQGTLRRPYRYSRRPDLGPEYDAAMDPLFDAYARSLPRVEAWAAARFPRADGEPEAAHRRSIRAKALDLLRGLLPAASLSHVGIFATGQAYEQLLLRLYASPLPEAHDYADMIMRDVKAVMPSFVMRVERPKGRGECSWYVDGRGHSHVRWWPLRGVDRE